MLAVSQHGEEHASSSTEACDTKWGTERAAAPNLYRGSDGQRVSEESPLCSQSRRRFRFNPHLPHLLRVFLIFRVPLPEHHLRVLVLRLVADRQIESQHRPMTREDRQWHGRL